MNLSFCESPLKLGLALPVLYFHCSLQPVTAIVFRVRVIVWVIDPLF